MAGAQRWINLAPDSPVAQWLQAKLLLRDGRVDEAAALLAKVTRSFPAEPVGTNTPASFGENLSVNVGSPYPSFISAGQQVLGESGVLHLAHREYVQSLDALLRSGYWMDAAYVAERVLTAEELKSYVDENWPPVSPEQIAKETDKLHSEDFDLTNARQQIRYLLARRLARLNRSNEALDYYPAEWKELSKTLASELKAGHDETLPAEQRAQTLFAAAFMTRTNGMELLGTEVEPDWRVYDGDFAPDGFAQNRTNFSLENLRASPDEFRRAESSKAEPDKRFHYRAVAASLCWEAATLLPDNSELAARILCTGGFWGDRDVFYKALVKRFRKTKIGKEAYRRGWLPLLADDGSLIPRDPPRLETLMPGTNIVMCSGDDLHDIAAAVNRAGFALTIKDILDANPGITAQHVPIGLKLEIPIIRREDGTPMEASTEFPQAGKAYYIHDGETIFGIARDVSKLGTPMTAEEILAANPGLEPKRIKIGSEIIIPDSR
jgi:phage tail protein X